MTKKSIKVAITGAAGQIGYALLFRIASGEMFGPNTKVTIHALELEQALPALDGVSMELADCAFPLLEGIRTTSSLEEAVSGVDWVICVGAVPRGKGMERSDLLNINGGIFTEQGNAINDHAGDDVKVLVVGNPCNTNALIAMNAAPDVPNDRFFAMTMLDELRARAQIALKLGVPVKEVHNTIIWGNHSATQYPDFYHAMVGEQSAFDLVKDEGWFKETFVSTVQQRGAAIINARGASSAASAANAIIESVKSIEGHYGESHVFSMCKCSNGEYGVDEGLIFSFPCISLKGKVMAVEGVEHNDYGQQKLKATLEELRGERDTVKEKGLI